MQRLIKLSLFAACGLVLGASMLNLGAPSACLLGWAFSIMLAGLCLRRRPSALKLSVLGFSGYVCGAWWMLPVIKQYGGLDAVSAFVLFVLYAALGSLQFGVIGALAGYLDHRLNRSTAALPLAWVLAELFFPRVFPWTLGHSQLAATILAQSADLIGPSLISGLMLWWSTAILRSVTERRPVRGFVAACISIAAVIGYGTFRYAAIEEAARAGRQIRVAAVQANLDPLVDFKPGQINIVPAKYRELSFTPVTQVPIDLLVWPESSIWESYPPDVKAVLPGAPEDPFPGLDIPLLFGGQSTLGSGNGEKPKLFNSLFLVQRDRQFSSYHKQLLFPFGERIPLRELFPALERLDRRPFTIAPGPPGQAPLLLPLGQDSPAIAAIGPAICYEDTFPTLLLEQVRRGATLLIALSNDAWFLDTPAAEMHHALASWTALQLRRYLIRATVDGVTGIIDPLGRTTASLPRRTAGVMVSDQARLLDLRSPYSYWGDAPLKLILILYMIGTVLYSRRRGAR